MNSLTRAVLVALLVPCFCGPLRAEVGKDNRISVTPSARHGNPVLENRVHKPGNVYFCVSNYGILGNQGDYILDPETGLRAPSCEFPAGSGIEYLFQSAIWVGAIVNGDTLVSTGHDGWQHVFEMYADAAPAGSIIKRSTRPTSPAYDPLAISEADYIAIYTDTLTDPAYVPTNPDDGRPHIPLGIKITQESYSWSQSEYEDFILVRYTIENIGADDHSDVRIGFMLDNDIAHRSTPNGFSDDVSGSIRIPSQFAEDSLLVGWSADTNGDPVSGNWNQYSARGVISTVLLETPAGTSQSFNWWISNGDDPAYLDWGPTLAANNRPLGTGGLGTPAGDRNKYYFMGNGERDYDQLWAAVNLTGSGWLPPNPVVATDLADGFDTKYLHSTEIGDLAAGEEVTFGLAIVMGPDLHVAPTDFAAFFNAANPQPFYDKLDFENLSTNVAAAEALYHCLFGDVPGDIDISCQVDIGDVVFLIDYLFGGGATPRQLNRADVNADCRINLADAVYLVNYIFLGGNPPQPGCIE